MSAESTIKEINSRVFSITCRRCNHVYNDEDHQPRLLPCLHDVCLDCLCELVFDETLTCPECKTSHRTPDNDVTIFQTDPVKLGLILETSETPLKVSCDFCDEEPTATYRCMDCLDNLCSDCLKIHKKYKKYKDHSVISLDEYSTLQQSHSRPNVECKVPGHSNEPIKFYCTDKDCGQCLCPSCVISHIELGHPVLKIDTVFDIRLKTIKGLDLDLQHQIERVEEAMMLIEVECNIVDKMATEAQREAEEAFNYLINLLKKRKSFVEHLITSEQENKRQILRDQEKEFQNRRNMIEDGKTYLKNVLENGTKSEFLSLEPIIRKQFLRLTKDDVHCLPCINPTIRFSSQNMIDDIEEVVDKFGSIVFSHAYSPFTRIEFPSFCHVEELFEVRLQLFNNHRDVIKEEEMDVQVCLVDPTERLTRSLCPCQQEEGGALITCFRVQGVGVYCVEVFILGRPFYIHPKQIEVFERIQEPSGTSYLGLSNLSLLDFC